MVQPDEDDALERAVVLLMALEDGTLKSMLSDIADMLNRDLSEFQEEILREWYMVVQAELDGPMPSVDKH